MGYRVQVSPMVPQSQAPEEKKELYIMGKGNRILPKEGQDYRRRTYKLAGKAKITAGICFEYTQLLVGQSQQDRA